MATYKTPEFFEKLKQLLVSSKFLYRDTSIPQETLTLFKVGAMFKEPTFCDATSKFGGIIGNTRFLIVCSSPKDFGMLSENPEWGLCAVGANETFKVIDVIHNESKSQVTVLHIPKGFEEYFLSEDAHMFEGNLTPQTREDFSEACSTKPLPELNTVSWRERVQHPIGVDNEGQLRSAA